MPFGYVPFTSIDRSTAASFSGRIGDIGVSSMDVVAHVTIAATGTVVIRGSNDLRDWVPLPNITVSSIVTLDKGIQYWQGVITANTGTISVVLGPARSHSGKLQNVSEAFYVA